MISAARISSGSLASEAWNAAAVPWNAVWMLAGMPICFCACSIALTASPSEDAGRELKESVTAGNWPWWLTISGVVPAS